MALEHLRGADGKGRIEIDGDPRQAALGHQAPHLHLGQRGRDAGQRLDLEFRRDLVEQVVDAFGFPRAHIHSGLPVMLPGTAPQRSEITSRVG